MGGKFTWDRHTHCHGDCGVWGPMPHYHSGEGNIYIYIFINICVCMCTCVIYIYMLYSLHAPFFLSAPR
jgi:hypothetical protein